MRIVKTKDKPKVRITLRIILLYITFNNYKGLNIEHHYFQISIKSIKQRSFMTSSFKIDYDLHQ
jgi:hypothetical protein